jgi:hypothetical protein
VCATSTAAPPVPADTVSSTSGSTNTTAFGIKASRRLVAAAAVAAAAAAAVRFVVVAHKRETSGILHVVCDKPMLALLVLNVSCQCEIPARDSTSRPCRSKYHASRRHSVKSSPCATKNVHCTQHQTAFIHSVLHSTCNAYASTSAKQTATASLTRMLTFVCVPAADACNAHSLHKRPLVACFAEAVGAVITQYKPPTACSCAKRL